MPSSQAPKQHDDSQERTEYTYRGRKIELYREGEQARLIVDGLEIEMEQNEEGVLSHSFMFKRFGTPFELAEELIKQWGNAKINLSPTPPPHHNH